MLNVEIISPEGIIFQGQCAMTVVPSAAGEAGVMEDHEAFVAELIAGKVTVYNEKNEIVKQVETKTGGFAEIHDGKRLIVLLDS